MEDKLIQLLETIKEENLISYPVYRQGALTEKKYPPSFFTFWNTDTPDHAHYDNEAYGYSWAFMINFYSIDANLTYSVLEQARQVLKEAGWIVSGKGYDVYSDEPTHTGRGLTIYYLETQQNDD